MANKVVRDDGTVRVRIIGPGKGSSATYEADQLKRDMHVFGKGTQVFFDHPGLKEERDRPERSLRDLCGVTTVDPVWEESGPAGPGPYTDVKVFKPYQPLLEEIGPHIGVSIRASGTVKTKKIGNESVRVAEKFTSGGFDFVTKAGAGGAVIPFNEAARTGVSDYVEEFLAAHPQESETSDSARAQFIEWATGESQPTPEEDDMEMKERVQQLETENAALKEAQTQLEEAKAQLAKQLMIRESAVIVEETILAEKDLPDVARARVRSQFKEAAPVDKDGNLDKDAIKTAVSEAIKGEKAYIESLRPHGVTGMGAASTTDDGKARLRESMIAMHVQNGESKEKAEKLADLAILGR